MRYSKKEILEFLKKLENTTASEFESETLEFKEWMANPKKLYKMLAEYAVCFANQKGGTIVLGVKNRVKGKEKAITGCGGYNIAEIKSHYNRRDGKDKNRKGLQAFNRFNESPEVDRIWSLRCFSRGKKRFKYGCP
ncbi:MAG: hypothetical protein B5M53_11980 [Candidatus Cloacimonas sp. 4484_209]|nr:MAG: hypothetical protein B5M53_11980 [Candidatus Cloacimonas sp. 4484_209]